MKPEIHPEYREVVFQDTSSDLQFLTRSTITSSETVEWEDGNTYPLAKVEISSESHPFYTGKQILVDSGGRVERFRKRYAKTGAAASSAAATPAPAAPASAVPEVSAEGAESPDSPDSPESVDSPDSPDSVDSADTEASADA